MTKGLAQMTISGITLLAHACLAGEVAAKAFPVDDYVSKTGSINADIAVRQAFKEAVAYGRGAVVVFGPGKYRLSPAASLHKDPESTRMGWDPCMFVNNAKGLTIKGAGASTELIVTKPLSQAIRLSDCEDVVIKDLVIDYDPLPQSRGSVTGVDRSTRRVRLRFRDSSGYLLPVGDLIARSAGTGLSGVISDPETGRQRDGSPAPLLYEKNALRQISGREFELHVPSKEWCDAFAKGDTFTVITRIWTGIITVWNTRNVEINNVTLYAGAGCGIMPGGCEGKLHINGVQILKRPGTDRVVSVLPDGIHALNNRDRLIIENCKFEGMADDPFNIHARTITIDKVVDAKTVRIKWNWFMNTLRPGDNLQVYSSAARRIRGRTKVVKRTGTELVLESSVAGMANGDLVFNLNACGAGSIVRNCVFAHFQGQGRMCAVNSTIENNVFENNTYSGVWIGRPDGGFHEGPIPFNVKILNNKFIKNSIAGKTGGFPVIDIQESDVRVGGEPLIKNILIQGNTIVNAPETAIKIHAVDGVVIEDNRIVATSGARAKQFKTGIDVSSSTNVVIRNLSIESDVKTTEAAVRIGTDVRNVRITALRAAMPKAAKPVINNSAKEVVVKP